jgi:hypothetical protein
MTVAVTINEGTTSTTDATECDEYTWNGTAYTTSGAYTFVTTNAEGCDSTATLNLTINNSTFGPTQSVSGCGSATLNGETWTVSGVYTQVLTNAAGCDSTMTVAVTIDTPITYSQSVQVCNGDSVLVGTSSYTLPGTYTDILTASNGCDSIVTTNVSIISAPNVALTLNGPAAFCEGDDLFIQATEGFEQYSWSNGETTSGILVTVEGAYSVTVTDANGCEGESAVASITVYPAPEPVLVANGPTEICPGETVSLSTIGVYSSYLWNNGETTSSVIVGESGLYSVSVNGPPNFCAASSNELEVIVYPEETALIVYGNGYLTVSPSNGTDYQWYLYDVLIEGADSTAYLPQQSGNYSVQYYDANGCLVIANYEYTFTSIASQNSSDQVSVYPNPSSGLYTMTFDKLSGAITYTVYDLMGRKIIHDSIAGNGQRVIKSLNLSAFANGMYSLRLDTESGSLVKRLIKE